MIKKRRLEVRMKHVLAFVQSLDVPTDSDLNLLDHVLREARRDMDRLQKPVYVLNEDVVSRAQKLLHACREDRRVVKERSHMKKVAAKLFQSLSHMEHEFRNRVEERISVELSKVRMFSCATLLVSLSACMRSK